VLFFHRVGENNARATDPKILAQQLEYLVRHFNPVSLETLVSAHLEGRALPSSSVALTVDDGYADFGQLVYPQLKRLGIPATLFVVSDFAAAKTWLWFDRLRYICERTDLPFFNVPTAADVFECFFRSDAEREASWDALATYCLKLAPTAREGLIAYCAAGGEVELPAQPDARYRALSTLELRAFDTDLITIGAHTRSHPILSTCTEAEQWDEIAGSKRDLELALQRPVRFFCYPNGQPADFNEASRRLVQAAGYAAAFTSVSSLIHSGTDPYLVPRVGASDEFSAFKNEVNGLTDLQARARGGLSAGGPGEIFRRALQQRTL
jgi:peptidoglycan/xylan/chitin deacetylase (PgdA/CDA1 family)